MTKIITELGNVFKDFYPKERFFKVSMFRLSAETYLVILIKKLPSEPVYQEVLFHKGKCFYKSVGSSEQGDIESEFEFMRRESEASEMISFADESLQEQEEKIINAFSELV